MRSKNNSLPAVLLFQRCSPAFAELVPKRLPGGGYCPDALGVAWKALPRLRGLSCEFLLPLQLSVSFQTQSNQLLKRFLALLLQEWPHATPISSSGRFSPH